jgi:hypothetical protein
MELAAAMAKVNVIPQMAMDRVEIVQAKTNIPSAAMVRIMCVVQCVSLG